MAHQWPSAQDTIREENQGSDKNQLYTVHPKIRADELTNQSKPEGSSRFVVKED